MCKSCEHHSYTNYQPYYLEDNEYLGREVRHDTNCAARHPFNKRKRRQCDAIRDCTQQYRGLEALNPLYYNAAIGACNSQTTVGGSIDDFLCDQFGGDTIFTTSGLVKCEFDPADPMDNPFVEEDDSQQLYLVAAVLAVILIILIFLIAR